MSDKSVKKAELNRAEATQSESSESSESERIKSKTGESAFSKEVGNMATRKLMAQRHATKTVWSGLGMMGLIGWSVAMPTVLGAVLGMWLDEHYPGGRSWTLMLLVVGLCLGCFNAWRWVDKEYEEIHQHDDGDDLD